MNEKKKIYIAGPMRGRADWNYPKFNGWAKALRRDGWVVENPAEISGTFGTGEELDANAKAMDALLYMERKIAAACDAIFMLEGWEASRGARDELGAFLAVNPMAPVYMESRALPPVLAND